MNYRTRQRRPLIARTRGPPPRRPRTDSRAIPDACPQNPTPPGDDRAPDTTHGRR